MDVERLIQLVRKHVYLYDIAHRDYKNIGLKTLAWESIAEELNQTSESVKQKWKTIKDSYIKYKKHLKKASGTGKNVIDYIWGAHLKFLDSYHASRKLSNLNVISQAALKSYPNQESQSPPPLDLLMPALQTASPSGNYLILDATQSPLTPPHVPAKRRKKNEPVATNNKKRKQKQNHDDIDYLFLSYAQTFKKFSLRQQAVLKMELAKLFSNAELEEFDNPNFNSAAFSCMPALGPSNVASPAYSSASSTGSNEPLTSLREKNICTIKEEITENPFPEEFQIDIVQFERKPKGEE